MQAAGICVSPGHACSLMQALLLQKDRSGTADAAGERAAELPGAQFQPLLWNVIQKLRLHSRRWCASMPRSGTQLESRMKDIRPTGAEPESRFYRRDAAIEFGKGYLHARPCQSNRDAFTRRAASATVVTASPAGGTVFSSGKNSFDTRPWGPLHRICDKFPHGAESGTSESEMCGALTLFSIGRKAE